MKYKVRTKDGVLDFESFGQVEQAWLLGLVGPDDDVLEEGKSLWRKAGSIPLLVQARRSEEQVWRGTWFLFTLIGVAGATVALVLLFSADLWMRLAGVLVALATAVMIVQVTVRASRRSRPH